MIADMIRTASKTLPYSELTYVGFRLAYCDTLERLELARQLGLGSETCTGYLCEVPFLRQVPVQVQLDLLMEVWSRHLDSREWHATLLDESVIYAAFETAARMIRIEPTIAVRFLARGPIPCSSPMNRAYADAVQKMHLEVNRDCRFLSISQFQDLPPQLSREQKAAIGLAADADQCLYDVLGRWYVSREFESRSVGLLTELEASQLRTVFSSTGCCVR